MSKSVQKFDILSPCVDVMDRCSLYVEKSNNFDIWVGHLDCVDVSLIICRKNDRLSTRQSIRAVGRLSVSRVSELQRRGAEDYPLVRRAVLTELLLRLAALVPAIWRSWVQRPVPADPRLAQRPY